MSRPTGSKNVTAFAYQHPSRCKACDSTERERYSNRTVEDCVTTLGDGMPITHVIRQNTACKACGQARVDVTYHFRPDGSRAADNLKIEVAGDIRDDFLAKINAPLAV